MKTVYLRGDFQKYRETNREVRGEGKEANRGRVKKQVGTAGSWGLVPLGTSGRVESVTQLSFGGSGLGEVRGRAVCPCSPSGLAEGCSRPFWPSKLLGGGSVTGVEKLTAW